MQPAWARWFRVESARRRTAGDVTSAEACALSALGLSEMEWGAIGEETRRVMVARWVEARELGARDRDEVAREVAGVPVNDLLAWVGARADCGGATPDPGAATPPELTTEGGTPRRVDTATGGPTAEERCALAALGLGEAEWGALDEAAQRERVTRWRAAREQDIPIDRMAVEVAAVPRGALLSYVAAKGGGCATDGGGGGDGGDNPLRPAGEEAAAAGFGDALKVLGVVFVGYLLLGD